MMHNGQLSDPLNEWTKLKKKITEKRKKTDSDYEEVGRLEWMGSLYLFNGAPCIPREAVKATILNAAKKSKSGPKVKSGVVVEEHILLLYDGPSDAKSMWADGRFTHRCTKPQKGQRVVRTRPMFYPWSADLPLVFNDEELNPEELDQFVILAGSSVGLLDERPEYGRFTVEKL